MTSPLRYILVGTGGMGRHWCSVSLPRLAEMGKAVPAAAVDIVPENLKNAQEFLKLPPEKCYTDRAKAFAETKADFAIVVVPPAHHESIVDTALEHDMHVLSEKPIADTMEACVRIFKKVKAAGRKMAVTMSHRFDQDKQSLEHEIKSGKHGELDYVVGRFTMACRKYGAWGKFRHEIPDTLLVEGAVHHFDIYRSLTSANCQEVYAVTWNPPWGEFKGDSQALITMKMTNGVKCLWEGAKCNASTLNGWGNDYFRAECRDGTLELDRRWLRVLKGAAWGKPLAQDLPLQERPVWTNPWLAEMFCDWLLGQREDHPTRVEDNIQCAALLFAAIESAHTGKVVNVQEFLGRHLNGV